MKNTIVKITSAVCAATIIALSFTACSSSKKAEYDAVSAADAQAAATEISEERISSRKSETKRLTQKETEKSSEKITAVTSTETRSSKPSKSVSSIGAPVTEKSEPSKKIKREQKTSVTEQKSTTKATTQKTTTTKNTTTKATTQAPTTTRKPVTTKKPATTSASSANIINDYAFLSEAAASLNAARRAAGVGELRADSGMATVASVRAKELSTNFSHTRPDGRQSSTAYADCGVAKPMAISENISTSKGYADAEDIVNVWLNSADHRANIINGKYTRFGLAWYKAEDGRQYCVLLLGNG